MSHDEKENLNTKQNVELENVNMRKTKKNAWVVVNKVLMCKEVNKDNEANVKETREEKRLAHVER